MGKVNNTDKKTDKRLANLKPAWKVGDPSPNPSGRPKGQRDYATIYREALLKIAEANDKTPEEIETMMEEMGMKNALKGNFAFWKDIRDRIHGTAVHVIDNKTVLTIDANTRTKTKSAISKFLSRD